MSVAETSTKVQLWLGNIRDDLNDPVNEAGLQDIKQEILNLEKQQEDLIPLEIREKLTREELRSLAQQHQEDLIPTDIREKRHILSQQQEYLIQSLVVKWTKLYAQENLPDKERSKALEQQAQKMGSVTRSAGRLQAAAFAAGHSSEEQIQQYCSEFETYKTERQVLINKGGMPDRELKKLDSVKPLIKKVLGLLSGGFGGTDHNKKLEEAFQRIAETAVRLGYQVDQESVAAALANYIIEAVSSGADSGTTTGDRDQANFDNMQKNKGNKKW